MMLHSKDGSSVRHGVAAATPDYNPIFFINIVDDKIIYITLIGQCFTNQCVVQWYIILYL